MAAIALAVLCAPGTWLRTPVSVDLPTQIKLVAIAPATPIEAPAWELGGIWQYSTGPDRYFGGFSALVALQGGHLRAFSDRGVRFVFHPPDHPEETPQSRKLARQLIADETWRWELWDIESATRDPSSGTYWLGYESTHVIQRFAVSSNDEERRILSDTVDWRDNAGAEAMVRLTDGRFVVVGEGQDEALVFPGDPTEGAAPVTVPFETPAPSYAVTDMTQLPDGRLLLLMRNVAWGFPPFECLIAIAPPPDPRFDKPWAPRVALRFDGVLPNENYEAIAVYPITDKKLAVWVMSDDNFSVMQRTLLVKLLFDPGGQG